MSENLPIQDILMTATLTVDFAPMLTVVFLGYRMRATWLTWALTLRSMMRAAPCCSFRRCEAGARAAPPEPSSICKERTGEPQARGGKP